MANSIVKEILGKCFKSSSALWQDYLAEEDNPRILYYPSSGEDMRPLVFSDPDCLKYAGVKIADDYAEPELFIFSDYYPHEHSRFFDSKLLHCDNNTSVVIDELCEIFPNSENYNYVFNREFVHFEAGAATGRAVFFQGHVRSHKFRGRRSKPISVLYFFYENVNLIDQLFLRHKLPVSHLVWKRDGTGFGGGSVSLNFLYQAGKLLNAEYFFIWDKYQDADNPVLVTKSAGLNRKYYPEEIKQYLTGGFTIELQKLGKLRWCIDDRMNLYQMI